MFLVPLTALSRGARAFAAIAAGFAAVSSGAMSGSAPTFPEVVASAEQIAQITVTGTHAQWDTTPTGQRVIHTYVTGAVRRVLKGDVAAPFELRFLGGKVDGTELRVPDMPQFEVGADYFVFVTGNGRSICPLAGAAHGSFRIVRDAEGAARVAQHDGSPLPASPAVAAATATDSVAALAPNLSPEDFRTAIQRQLNRSPDAHAN